MSPYVVGGGELIALWTERWLGAGVWLGVGSRWGCGMVCGRSCPVRMVVLITLFNNNIFANLPQTTKVQNAAMYCDVMVFY